MATSIVICVSSFFWLLWLLRRSPISLGLPIAYLFALLLIHVPGAYVHLMTNYLRNSDMVEVGIRYTAIGAVSFVAGVWAVGFFSARRRPVMSEPDTRRFSLFCLFGGWIFIYGLSSLHSIPSLGAAVDSAGAIWMLGVMLGLRSAVQQANIVSACVWLAALAVYPVLMLLLGGFLSYGSTAIIIVLSMLGISTRSHGKVFVGLIVGVYLGLNVFINYFEHRTEIRNEVWGGAPLANRIDATLDVIREFKWFDSDNRSQVIALDARLNQNFFAGLAGSRIEQGSIDFLYGRSIWEGLIALVPRALWPEKPVVAGSPKIVSEMTGLRLSQNTSFGVGNVMEFQINFGIPGLAAGFFILGFLLRTLDWNCAAAIGRGDLGKAIIFFLPAVALIQPNGSVVELSGGSAAALVAAFGWQWVWTHWSRRKHRLPPGYAPGPVDMRLPRR